jgi:hypothetical protein
MERVLLCSLFMGESFEAVVEAFDNPSDKIQFLGVSKVCLADCAHCRWILALLALVTVSRSGGRQHGRQAARAGIVRVHGSGHPEPSKPERALIPRLVQPGIPPFLSLIVGGPRPETIAAAAFHITDRMVSYTPTRMHSGLEFSLCFLAVDAPGVCPKDVAGKNRIGSAMERCMLVTVHRCKYALNPGQELSHIAGLFETNWIQLFALNPTFQSPEVPLPGTDKHVVNIGHLYEVGQHPLTLR